MSTTEHEPDALEREALRAAREQGTLEQPSPTTKYFYEQFAVSPRLPDNESRFKPVDTPTPGHYVAARLIECRPYKVSADGETETVRVGWCKVTDEGQERVLVFLGRTSLYKSTPDIDDSDSA